MPIMLYSDKLLLAAPKSTIGYADSWRKQLLQPLPKKGHTPTTPKLRGIAISSLLPKIYDIMLNNRLKTWYTPNKEQAGFRPKQGCLVQIFVLYLLIELANSVKSTIYIGFMDYEKAFDFTNRADIIQHLISNNAGTRFINAISKMYEDTVYIPKINSNQLGRGISTKHGVTQGRKTSENLFSFNISTMASSITINLYRKKNCYNLLMTQH